MSLLHRTLFAWKCKNTHHKLAMDALCHLQCERSEQWHHLFLKHIENYLQGSKAPDKEFKDFRNHVLHVEQGYWGGAERLAEKWYENTVHALRDRNWKRAAYSAGVLSHYYTDPIQPFHTAQSDAESIIHRAVEWSIACAYDSLKALLINDLGGYPHVPLPQGQDWLPEMVRRGAETANPHYQALIDHYDFDKGIKDPTRGLDNVSMEIIASLIGYATVGFSHILERAIEESGISPPKTNIGILGILASCTIPIFWITKKITDADERKIIEEIYHELKTTGSVENYLPEDDKQIKQLYHTEILNEPLQQNNLVKNASTETRSENVTRVSDQPTVLQFNLNADDLVEDAPSIGPKTAKHLQKIGVKKVSDLLKLKPLKAASLLNTRYITAEVILEWQDQARLACCVPNLRGHDAQILVAVGISQPEFLTQMTPEDLLAIVKPFIKTAEGKRIIRSGKSPDLDEMANWIDWSTHARPMKAA